jgi:uncharacterized membrane protein
LINCIVIVVLLVGSIVGGFTAKNDIDISVCVCGLILSVCVFIVFLRDTLFADLENKNFINKIDELINNKIDFIKEIYIDIKKCDINYFDKNNGTYQKCSITHNGSVQYIDSDCFELIGKINQGVYKVTLYIPVKYNDDYRKYN